MKLHLNSGDQKFMIRSCRQLKHGYQIGIGEEYYNSSLILTPEKLEMWGVHEVSDLTIEHFADLCRYGAEVVILGTGRQITFPDPAYCQPLMKSGTGLEVMDTAAACRTYNILLADRRDVVAGLIL
jgi:uncharacterized protein